MCIHCLRAKLSDTRRIFYHYGNYFILSFELKFKAFELKDLNDSSYDWSKLIVLNLLKYYEKYKKIEII